MDALWSEAALCEVRGVLPALQMEMTFLGLKITDSSNVHDLTSSNFLLNLLSLLGCSSVKSGNPVQTSVPLFHGGPTEKIQGEHGGLRRKSTILDKNEGWQHVYSCQVYWPSLLVVFVHSKYRDQIQFFGIFPRNFRNLVLFPD